MTKYRCRPSFNPLSSNTPGNSNQEIYVTNVQLEHFKKTEDTLKDLYGDLMTLQYEVKDMNYKMDSLLCAFLKDKNKDNELYEDMKKVLKYQNQTNEKYLRKILGQYRTVHEDLLQQLGSFKDRWQKDEVQKMINGLSSQLNTLEEKFLQQLNESLALNQENNLSLEEISLDMPNSDIPQDGTLEPVQSKKRYENQFDGDIEELLLVLPENYPVSALFVNGKKVLVTNLIKYDKQSHIAYFIKDDAQVNFDIHHINGIILR